MKAIFFSMTILSVLVTASSALADGSVNSSTLRAVLSEAKGVYNGFAPTDESPTATGQIRITVMTDGIQIEMAGTPSKKTEETVPAVGLTPLTRQELETVYQPGSEYLKRSFGFQANGVKFVFLRQPKTNIADPFGKSEFALIVRGRQMADLLGPTILFSDAKQPGLFKAAGDFLKKNQGPFNELAR